MNFEQSKMKAIQTFNDRIEQSLNRFRLAEDELIDEPENRFLKLRQHQAIALIKSDASEIIKLCNGFYPNSEAISDLLIQEKLS